MKREIPTICLWFERALIIITVWVSLGMTSGEVFLCQVNSRAGEAESGNSWVFFSCAQIK